MNSTRRDHCLFAGLTFYVQPICNPIKKSSLTTAQYEHVIQSVRRNGGTIVPSPTYSRLTHIILTHNSYDKDEIFDVGRPKRKDTHTIKWLDDNGWATFRLLENFGEIVNSPHRNTHLNSSFGHGHGHDHELLEGHRKMAVVVVKKDWVHDCVRLGRVLGEEQNWLGWKVKGRYPDDVTGIESVRPYLKPTPVTNSKPSSISNISNSPILSTNFDPPEYDNEPVKLNTRYYPLHPIKINPSIRLPSMTWSTRIPAPPNGQFQTHYLELTPDQLKSKIYLTGYLPPDPRFSHPYGGKKEEYEHVQSFKVDGDRNRVALLDYHGSQKIYEEARGMRDVSFYRNYGLRSEKMGGIIKDPRKTLSSCQNVSSKTQGLAAQDPDNPLPKLAISYAGNEDKGINIILPPSMNYGKGYHTNLILTQQDGIRLTTCALDRKSDFSPLPEKLINPDQTFDDSDLDCLDSDWEEADDKTVTSKDAICVVTKRKLPIHEMTFKKKTKIDKVTHPQIPGQLNLQYKTENSVYLPPTPVSAFPKLFADSQASGFNSSKEHERRPSLSTDLDSNSIDKKDKPSTTQICQIFAREICDHPDEAFISISKRLEMRYQGRKWKTWLSRYRNVIEKMIKRLDEKERRNE
ncbi:hypothetical protein V865_001900 [Kwoniella europaea PYCC6329]|uniref:BRCT domain-containing protein n=1 Tax=Kwoniella europaea PYCC6329 TaxID=1423913 RepID=A0AAX4KD06_9TREE